VYLSRNKRNLWLRKQYNISLTNLFIRAEFCECFVKRLKQLGEREGIRTQTNSRHLLSEMLSQYYNFGGKSEKVPPFKELNFLSKTTFQIKLCGIITFGFSYTFRINSNLHQNEFNLDRKKNRALI
jgi:hypothetical protein